MSHAPRLLFTLVITLAILVPRSSHATWQLNGWQLNASAGLHIVGIVSDGDKGAFVGWAAYSSPWDVAVARVSKEGNTLWLTTVVGSPHPKNLKLISDGNGGVQLIAVHSSYPNGEEVWVQRVTASGDIVFPFPWVVVGYASYYISGTDAVLLDNGETQIAWCGLYYSSDGWQLFGQRLDAQGNAMWEADGRALLPVFSPYYSLDGVGLIPGTGGSFFGIWNRSHSDKGGDTYFPAVTREFNSSGIAGGSEISLGSYTYSVTSDGAGGVIGTYESNNNIYATRVLDGGTSAWGTAAVCDQPEIQQHPEAVADGSGGAIVLWDDSRDGTHDVYAQHVDAFGTATWPADGVNVTNATGDQWKARAISDGAGGAIVLWNEAGSGDLYAQRVGPDGSNLWGAGVPVAIAPGSQAYPRGVLDDDNGVLVAWDDTRLDPDNQQPLGVMTAAYTQRLSLTDGAWGSTVAVAISSFHASVHDHVVELGAVFQSDLVVKRINVYRGSAPGPMQRIATVDGAATNRFQFTDDDVSAGTTYRYRIGVVDGDGEFLSSVATVTMPSIVTSLEQNAPNPFNPETTIRFVLAQPSRATVEIFTPDGRSVRSLYDRITPAGRSTVTWDGTDDDGNPVSSGVYLYRLTAGKFSQSRKMLLIK